MKMDNGSNNSLNWEDFKVPFRLMSIVINVCLALALIACLAKIGSRLEDIRNIMQDKQLGSSVTIYGDAETSVDTPQTTSNESPSYEEEYAKNGQKLTEETQELEQKIDDVSNLTMEQILDNQFANGQEYVKLTMSKYDEEKRSYEITKGTVYFTMGLVESIKDTCMSYDKNTYYSAPLVASTDTNYGKALKFVCPKCTHDLHVHDEAVKNATAYFVCPECNYVSAGVWVDNCDCEELATNRLVYLALINDLYYNVEIK